MSWKAVLKTEGPICQKSVEARRAVLRSRGFRRVRMLDPAFSDLKSLLNNSPYVRLSGDKSALVWAMSNASNTQYTIGTLDHYNEWKAGGWAAEHLICLTAGVPMPTLRSSSPILKPRVRRLILNHGSMCHFCSLPMPLSDVTIEHWFAKSLGGDNRYENLRLAHRRCNEIAGSLSIRQKNRIRHQMREKASLRVEFLHRRRAECNGEAHS